MTGSDRDRRAETDGPIAVTRRTAERPRPVAAAFAVVVFVGSVVPVPTTPGESGGALGEIGSALGEVAGVFPVEIGVTAPFHFLGYAVLAALLVRAASREPRVGSVVVAVTAATAFGFGIELVQAPLPWRSFAWSDAAVNAVGAVVGAGGDALRRARSGERSGR